MKPYPHAGAALRLLLPARTGFDVEIFDTTFASREDLLARLAAEPGGVVGIYTNLMTRRRCCEVMAAAKARGSPVVVGGPESANYLEEYLSPGRRRGGAR